MFHLQNRTSVSWTLDTKFCSHSIRIEVAPSCKTIVTGVTESVDVEPVQAWCEPEHPSMDSHVACPLWQMVRMSEESSCNLLIMIILVQC